MFLGKNCLLLVVELDGSLVIVIVRHCLYLETIMHLQSIVNLHRYSKYSDYCC